jgi:hypothetical protein
LTEYSEKELIDILQLDLTNLDNSDT